MTTVRRAELEELPALRAIQSTALAEPWPALLAAEAPFERYVLVAPDPVGYAVVLDGGVRRPDGTRVAYLPELAVRPDRQGRGHGSRLLEWLCARLAERGCGELRLTVRAGDERARAFYADRGFDRRDRVEGHFECGDGLVLGRALE